MLLASAAGDALGAGYEFTTPAPDLVPAMIGGGLGDFAPGQWTDDTDQAMAIARVAATGVDLRSPEALDGIAAGFAEWYAGGPPDVGTHTSQVLELAGHAPSGEVLFAASREIHRRNGRSAGNGSLMRTGPVALSQLHDPTALAAAADAVGALTHVEDHAREACVVWCLMIRHTVLSGTFPRIDDIADQVPQPEKWQQILATAETTEPGEFTNNGWAVGALQAAWSAITHSHRLRSTERTGRRHLINGLNAAIRIGHDTDTVAAIAGALLGAHWGASAVPAGWRRMLHGWPGLTAIDLEALATRIATGGDGPHDWTTASRIAYADWPGRTALAPHPYDDGVVLAGIGALDALPEGTDAVVSLCLTGRRQVPADVEHLTFRLIDSPDPQANPNLAFVIMDAARTVRQLRSEGKRVLLHCVQAQSRTPTVATAYAMLLGVRLPEALARVRESLPAAAPNDAFLDVLRQIASPTRPNVPTRIGIDQIRKHRDQVEIAAVHDSPQAALHLATLLWRGSDLDQLTGIRWCQRVLAAQDRATYSRARRQLELALPQWHYGQVAKALGPDSDLDLPYLSMVGIPPWTGHDSDGRPLAVLFDGPTSVDMVQHLHNDYYLDAGWRLARLRVESLEPLGTVHPLYREFTVPLDPPDPTTALAQLREWLQL